MSTFSGSWDAVAPDDIPVAERTKKFCSNVYENIAAQSLVESLTDGFGCSIDEAYLQSGAQRLFKPSDPGFQRAKVELRNNEDFQILFAKMAEKAGRQEGRHTLNSGVDYMQLEGDFVIPVKFTETMRDWSGTQVRVFQFERDWSVHHFGNCSLDSF